MKPKRILVLFNSIDTFSYVRKESVLSNLLKELSNKGTVDYSKIKYSISNDLFKFENGSSIFTLSITRNLGFVRGGKFTHIYIDSEIFNLENGQEIKNIVNTLLIQKGQFEDLSIEGERVIEF